MLPMLDWSGKQNSEVETATCLSIREGHEVGWVSASWGPEGEGSGMVLSLEVGRSLAPISWSARVISGGEVLVILTLLVVFSLA